MLRFFIAPFFVISLSGCVSTVQPQPQNVQSFYPSEYWNHTEVGNGVITGEGFLRQRGGGVVTCAGSPVSLLPNTQYFRQFVKKSLNNRYLSPLLRTKRHITAEMKSVIRETYCDAQGKFTFYNLPSENWIIMTNVSWDVGYRQEGGDIAEFIKSIDGQTVSGILSTIKRPKYFYVKS